MTSPAGPLPDDVALVAAVAPLLAAAADRACVTLVARRPNPCFSTAPTEIITLDVAGRGPRELFLKYDRGSIDPEPRCRHGLAHCGQAYSRLVGRASLPHVKCLGLVEAGSPPRMLLVLEHVAGAVRVNETADDSGVIAAAEWCGRLHAWGAAKFDDPSLAFLVRYDLAYYRAWAARARGIATALGPVPAWLEQLCTDFESPAVALAAAERTTIHGEFGPQNVLWRDGVVYPVDWESAAVGPGAIDLATLLFGWPADVVRRGIESYWGARGCPAAPGFAAAFAAATVYTALRWLPVPAGGDDPAWREALARLQTAALSLRR
jgi:aminoglycoside phosphotransferase (APT) family kinase protein